MMQHRQLSPHQHGILTGATLMIEVVVDVVEPLVDLGMLAARLWACWVLI